MTKLVLAVFLVLGVITAAFADPPQDALVRANLEALDHGSSTVLGNPSGDVTIVEFFDYACPFCKALQPRLEAFLAKDRKVRLVLKEFPILTPASIMASKAALAAERQGRYAQFHLALMHLEGSPDGASILATARSVGLDMVRLQKDMASPATLTAIRANFDLAKKLHVQGTPTVIVGDHLLTQPSAQIDFAKEVASIRVRKSQGSQTILHEERVAPGG